MAYDENLANRIREALSHLAKVEEKKMFGGLAFMVNGKMCITVGKGRIMCRIDPATHDEAIKSKGIESVKMGGREYKGYIHLNEDAIRTNKDFDYWIASALEFNKVAKASKKK
jgi:TfoX/Sxy family transcriptional regulator of competence genes